MTKKEKQELDRKRRVDYYEQFFNLYNEENVIFDSEYFKHKILSLAANWIEVKRIVNILKWFWKNYNKEYRVMIGFHRNRHLCATISRYGFEFATYQYSDGVIIPFEYECKLLENYLKEQEIYDRKKHYVVYTQEV